MANLLVTDRQERLQMRQRGAGYVSPRTRLLPKQLTNE